MRYIDADKLMKHLDSAESIGFGIIETKLVRDLVNEAPTADVKPVVYGEWIKPKDPMSIYITCSACGTMTVGRSNYCSNCGAKMSKRKNTTKNADW